MKLVIYLTKTKVWYGAKSVDWGGGDLVKIFNEIRKDERVKDVRIVLGDDVSYVASFKIEEKKTREKIEDMTRGWLPFVLENNCFDYRLLSVSGETWVQSVAVEKWLLDAVSKSVWESGLNLELMIPIGVLLAEKTGNHENPMLVKWSGFENISVLAVNGLADSVYGNEDDARISKYAKEKWGLENDMEVLSLDGSKFNLNEEVFKEKNKGDDAVVLSIPVLRKQEISEEKTEIDPSEPSEPVEEAPKKSLSKTTMFLIFVLLISLVIMSVVLYGYFKPVPVKVVPPVAPVPIVAAPTATPSATIAVKVDLSKYTVQVLNGSGVTGEAGRIKELLLTKGFVTVDTGNASDTTDTLISRKSEVPESVIGDVKSEMGSYKFGDIGPLTSTDKYDLVIVLGSNKI